MTPVLIFFYFPSMVRPNIPLPKKNCVFRHFQILVQQLFKLARASSAALEQLRVKEAPSTAHANAYLSLFKAARLTLAHGLGLLGLPALERV